MGESFVNRYVVVLGHCGLGGTAYEIHATTDDLLLLAKKLEEQIGTYREGTHALQLAMKRDGMEIGNDVPFPVLTEYVTLSEVRTDRMCIRFCVEKSLQEHHVMKSGQFTAGTVGLGLAKLFLFLVFPLIGVTACLGSFFKWITGYCAFVPALLPNYEIKRTPEVTLRSNHH